MSSQSFSCNNIGALNSSLNDIFPPEGSPSHWRSCQADHDGTGCLSWYLLAWLYHCFEQDTEQNRFEERWETSHISPTMEDWFAGEKLSKYATNCPNVNRLKEKIIRKKWSWKQYLGIMTRSQQQFWSSVPESHHHWIKVCQWLQRRVEEPGDKSKLPPIINFQKPCKAHVCNLDPPPLQTLPHHKNIGRFQVSEFFVWLVSFFKSKVFDKPV